MFHHLDLFIAEDLLQRRRSGDGHALLVVDDLGRDLLGGAEHAQARPTATRMSGDRAADARLAPIVGLAGIGHDGAPYFFLPSLRKINSSEYFTPLPL